MEDVLDEDVPDYYSNFEFEPAEEYHYESPLRDFYRSNFYGSHVGRLFITGLMTTSAIGPGRIWTANTTTQLGYGDISAQRPGYPAYSNYDIGIRCCIACREDFPATIMFNYQKELSRCVCLKATPETTPTTKAPYTLGKCEYQTSPGKFCTENGVYFTMGPVLKELTTGGQEECSSACSSTTGCVGWTLHLVDNQCFLVDKSHDLVKGRGEGWVTGTRDCGLNRGTPLGLITPSSVDMNGEVGGVENSERCCEECNKAHNGTELYAYINTDKDSENMFQGDKDRSCMCYTKKQQVKPVTSQSNFYAGVCGAWTSALGLGENCKTTPSRRNKNGYLSKGNARCIFPFRYFGVIYYTCAPGSATNKNLSKDAAKSLPEDAPWCSTKVDRFGDHVKGEWGFCSEGCT